MQIFITNSPQKAAFILFTPALAKHKGGYRIHLPCERNAIMFRREMDAENPMTTATDIIH